MADGRGERDLEACQFMASAARMITAGSNLMARCATNQLNGATEAAKQNRLDAREWVAGAERELALAKDALGEG